MSCARQGAGYDYDEAAAVYSDLPAALERVQLGATEKLQAQLPGNVSVAQVGEELHASLTAIIALPWSPQSSKHHLAAVVDDIAARMSRRSSKVRRSGMRARSPSARSPALAPLKEHHRELSKKAASTDEMELNASAESSLTEGFGRVKKGQSGDWVLKRCKSEGTLTHVSFV